jgi:hypothetical protein
VKSRLIAGAIAGAFALTSLAAGSAHANEGGGIGSDNCSQAYLDGEYENTTNIIGDSVDLEYEGETVGQLLLDDPSDGYITVELDDGYVVDLCMFGGTDKQEFTGLEDGAVVGPLVNPGGEDAALSNIAWTVRFVGLEEEPPEGEWCSPGFWRNNYGAWPEGYSPSTVDPVTGKTFGEILASPKLYASTGDYERIADILSDAHPDVDFSGDRGYFDEDGNFVQFDCPLSADEANKG